MTHIRVEEVPARLVAVVRREVPVTALAAFYADAAAAVEEAVSGAGGVIAGPLCGWYHAMVDGTFDLSAGFPVAGLAVGPLDGEVLVRQRPGGMAAVALHLGPYDTLQDTYRAVDVWLNDRQLDASDEDVEEYLSDPGADPDPATWETRVVRPLV